MPILVGGTGDEEDSATEEDYYGEQQEKIVLTSAHKKILSDKGLDVILLNNYVGIIVKDYPTSISVSIPTYPTQQSATITAPETLSATTTSPLHATNGLLRLNYFNGRYLTAEALRREQHYWDARARLAAMAHGSGIAWGLGLDTEAASPSLSTPADGLRWSANAPLVLRPGLAFDSIGRPIAVSSNFTFTLAPLLTNQATTPLVVLSGGTSFAPCVQLAPVNPANLSGQLQTGAFLLVISPVEQPDGEARVYGSSCQGSTAPMCAFDSWRSGFELRLAALNVTLPQNATLTLWELQGLLAAWYFDVYERDLSARWDALPGLLPNGGVPGAPPAMVEGVPLALVYVSPDGGIGFVDRWIPRRLRTHTTAASWAEAAVGAPPPSQRTSRLQQFQSMLEESLVVLPLGSGGGVNATNLAERGFRHLPPWGWLPVPPHTDTDADLTVRIEHALIHARAWFKDTNVITADYIAVHDDEMLEEMRRAEILDPILLTHDSQRPTTPTTEDKDNALGIRTLGPFRDEVEARGVGYSELVNREVELVKLIVPLSGRYLLWPEEGTTVTVSSGPKPREFVLFVRHALVTWDEPELPVIPPAEPPPPLVLMEEPLACAHLSPLTEQEYARAGTVAERLDQIRATLKCFCPGRSLTTPSPAEAAVDTAINTFLLQAFGEQPYRSGASYLESDPDTWPIKNIVTLQQSWSDRVDQSTQASRTSALSSRASGACRFRETIGNFTVEYVLDDRTAGFDEDFVNSSGAFNQFSTEYNNAFKLALQSVFGTSLQSAMNTFGNTFIADLLSYLRVETASLINSGRASGTTGPIGGRG